LILASGHETEEENVLNETARVEFPSKKPAKEMDAYNKYLHEPLNKKILNTSNPNYMFERLSTEE